MQAHAASRQAWLGAVPAPGRRATSPVVHHGADAARPGGKRRQQGVPLAQPARHQRVVQVVKDQRGAGNGVQRQQVSQAEQAGAVVVLHCGSGVAAGRGWWGGLGCVVGRVERL